MLYICTMIKFYNMWLYLKLIYDTKIISIKYLIQFISIYLYTKESLSLKFLVGTDIVHVYH